MAGSLVVNALALRPFGTGVQTYIRELLGALVDELGSSTSLCAVVQADAVGSLPERIEPHRRPVAAGLRRALSGLRSVPDADVVHGLDVDLPWRVRGAAVTTVHDMMVFDVPWAGSRARSLAERQLVRHALRTADRIVAVSSFTAERVSAITGRDAVVIPEGPPVDLAPPSAEEVDAARRALDLPPRFALAVGTVERRKGLDVLGAACREIDLPLLLSGLVTDPAMVPAGARTLGYVDRALLPSLYGAATVVGYPSVYEGFGLPPLEAMSCGAPVVASDTTSLPEVLGDGALLLPRRAERWAAALRELVEDDAARDDLRARGGSWVAGRSGLSWSRAATETAAVYRELGLAA